VPAVAVRFQRPGIAANERIRRGFDRRRGFRQATAGGTADSTNQQDLLFSDDRTGPTSPRTQRFAPSPKSDAPWTLRSISMDRDSAGTLPYSHSIINSLGKSLFDLMLAS
jgi:hypothetical protein